ncbi:MAG: glucokinase [Gemmatimonadota bacterium]
MAQPVSDAGGAKRLFVLPTAEELARAAAGRLWGIVRERADALGRAGGGRRTIAVALSGGETPRPVYEALASPPYRERFPWDIVHFFQVDERWVPAGDPRSNARMIEETLLSRAPVPRRNFHPVDTSLPTPADGARRYEEALREFFGAAPGGFPRFDAVLLGVGRDGHTASLFPGSPALGEATAWVAEASGGDPPLDRVTLTLPVINAAARVVFVARGKQKAEAVGEIMAGGAAPAARVSPKRGTVTVLADSPAASRAAGTAQRGGPRPERRATIVAGDVGGTKTNLALFEPDGRRLVRREMRSFPSRDYPALEAILAEFLSGSPRVESVCLGVAGPVYGGRSRLTNLPWVVDREKVRAAAGARRAFLLNDLQATAFAVPFLAPDAVAVLQEGAAAEGTIGVIAAGTGLGEALLVKAGAGWLPVATEGGHVDFAPRGELQVRLQRYLGEIHGRVSVERVLSGPGLEAIYRFLLESEAMQEAAGVASPLSADDPPRAIAREGLAKDSGACREALRLFVSVYGAQAGNLALQVMATGGIYLGGGIAPAILPALGWGEFLDAFRDKGRFRELLESVPVRVILDDTAALLGAARYALAEGGVT